MEDSLMLRFPRTPAVAEVEVVAVEVVEAEVVEAEDAANPLEEDGAVAEIAIVAEDAAAEKAVSEVLLTAEKKTLEANRPKRKTVSFS
jgi:hypothetical protein